MTDYTLTRYASFRPTGCDVAGLNASRLSRGSDDDDDDGDRSTWLVAPCGTNRDANLLTESNWYAQDNALKEEDPNGLDHETHRFGHWACGWFEITLVRPNTKAADEAQKIADALSDYPVLNESDFSEREFNATYDYIRDEVSRLASRGKWLSVASDGCEPVEPSESQIEQAAAEVMRHIDDEMGGGLPSHVNQDGGGSVSEDDLLNALEACGYQLASEDDETEAPCSNS